MVRDDSFLYSGVSSSEQKETPRKVQAEQKEKLRLKLKPAVESVLELISSERDNVTNIRSFVLDRESTEGEVLVELKARKLYIGYLNALEAKVNNIMKVKS